MIYCSGVTTALTELMEQLIDLNIDVYLWHGGFEIEDPLLINRISTFGGRVKRIDMPSSKNKFLYLWEYFKFTLSLRRKLREVNPDVIHLHSAVLGLAFSLNRIDVVQTIHQAKMKLGIFRVVPKLEIAVSGDILVESRQHHGVRDENSVCIHNPVKFNRFFSRDESTVDGIKRAYNLADYNFVITTVANIEHRKGHDVLIKAVNRLIELNKNIKPIVLFAGRILDFDYYNSIVISARVDVKHISFCNPESLFWASDVHVLASRRESFPVAIIESMAAGVCSIRSNTEGASDQIIDGVTGFLFENENHNELSDVLNNLYYNSALRIKVAVDGSRFVKDNFDGKIIAEKTLNEYSKLKQSKIKYRFN
jgi:glycosyltransferase involved in cell wall biosynthesis